jgi:hypothetical protein
LALVSVTGIQAKVSAKPCAGQSHDRLREVLDVFRDRESARVIGAKYLERSPAEEDLDVLIDSVLSPAAERTSDTGDGVDYWQIISANRANDFEHGRMTAIDGWLLSKTEARLCAIAALL